MNDAERILCAWNEHQDRWVHPQHQEGRVIPALILAECSLPDALFDTISEIWDIHFRAAIQQATAIARLIRELGSEE